MLNTALITGLNDLYVKIRKSFKLHFYEINRLSFPLLQIYYLPEAAGLQI